MSWKEKLQSWDAIQIQRWYGLNSSTDAELHIFTDASTLAYGAVAYFRYNEGNDTRCSFIMSKSRLAPIKQKTLTVPKLELQAAVVACRMKNVILDEVKLEIKSVYFWCDSKTVINYLKNETTNFGVYIAHRVNEIRRSSSIEDWYYVPTKLNVADDLTRFTGFQTLTNQSRWCTGPEFLLQDNIKSVHLNLTKTASVTLNECINPSAQLESNADKITIKEQDRIDTSIPYSKSDIQKQHILMCINWYHYSSFITLIRHLSWILKLKLNWIKRKRGIEERENFRFLTTAEINQSRIVLLRQAQLESFSNEYNLMSSSKPIPSNSKLIGLNPIFDEGLIKVGGRIRHANIPKESKHQIILFKGHPLTQLITRNVHEDNLHVGREHTLAIIRQQYWIPRCRGMIRRILSNCVKCKKERAMPESLLMGDLPKERVKFGEKPFSNTGVDYFGPYHVKKNRETRSTKALTKRYGVIFTCLATRAIHIELAGDLSTDSFLLALRRFISRRGNVRVMRSDNGTNFVGANNELNLCIKQLDQIRLHKFSNHKNIEWIFNPPASPWMGGVWESLVKSVKTGLKAIVKDRIFTDESLQTFLCEVESVLNGRPLTAISDDISDFEPLTPNHLLIGEVSPNQSPGNFREHEVSLRRKWRSVQAATEMFWRRWVREYLPILTIRRKWNSKSRNFKVGDLVIVITKDIPRSYWPMGRVLETYRGSNDVVRVVKLKTASGEMIRPVSKIALLEANLD